MKLRICKLEILFIILNLAIKWTYYRYKTSSKSVKHELRWSKNVSPIVKLACCKKHLPNGKGIPISAATVAAKSSCKESTNKREVIKKLYKQKSDSKTIYKTCLQAILRRQTNLLKSADADFMSILKDKVFSHEPNYLRNNRSQ